VQEDTIRRGIRHFVPKKILFHIFNLKVSYKFHYEKLGELMRCPILGELISVGSL
jgi:hypothetical protein